MPSVLGNSIGWELKNGPLRSNWDKDKDGSNSGEKIEKLSSEVSGSGNVAVGTWETKSSENGACSSTFDPLEAGRRGYDG